MAFGTFDILHPGHLHFLEKARALGDFLIVALARDENVKKIKGVPPLLAEKDRLAVIQNLKMVDKAVLGSRTDYLARIRQERPDIIALGYDQKIFVKELQGLVRAGNMKLKIVRLKPFLSGKYKSSKYKELIQKSKH